MNNETKAVYLLITAACEAPLSDDWCIYDFAVYRTLTDAKTAAKRIVFSLEPWEANADKTQWSLTLDEDEARDDETGFVIEKMAVNASQRLTEVYVLCHVRNWEGYPEGVLDFENAFATFEDACAAGDAGFPSVQPWKHKIDDTWIKRFTEAEIFATEGYEDETGYNITKMPISAIARKK